MSGAESGVQALVRKKLSTADREAFVPYNHCPPHQLDLVLQHAAERNAPILVLNFLELFSYSTRFLLTHHNVDGHC